MRNYSFLLRLAVLVGTVLTLGACSDSPTEADERRPDLAALAQDGQVAPQGCVIDGTCILPPIVVDGGCDPWMELDWSCEDGGGGECMTSVGGPTAPELGITVQSCLPGGGPGGDGGTLPPPGGEDEGEYTDICPQPVSGKVATTLVNVAGRNHEFKFEGTFRRVNPLVGRSPAWYRIDRPALSKDSWWIAESGNLLLVCWGRWIRGTLWLGTMYVQDTELHMVMGPGHPDF